MIISKFEQSKNTLRISLSGLIGDRVQVVQYPVVPQIINAESLIHSASWNKSFPIYNGTTDIRIDFIDYDEPNNAEYSLLFITDGEIPLKFNYLEIVRQSEKWLKDNFRFYREGGYCIEGRLALQHSQSLMINSLRPIIFFGTEKSTINWSNFKKSIVSMNQDAEKFMIFPEVKQATNLLKQLLALQLNTGPVNTNHKEYNDASLNRRIEMLINGEYAVQCSGLRDLFVWIYRVQGFSVRNIDANCSISRFKDLISYGHSLCEIFIRDINKWVIFDPWFGGTMIIDEDGLVGVDGLTSGSAGTDKKLSLISVIKSYNRHVLHSASGKGIHTFHIDNLYLYSYYFAEQLGSTMPAYLDYFKFVRRRSVHVFPRFSGIPRRLFQRVINRICTLVN